MQQYNSSIFVHEKDIALSDITKELLKNAQKVYFENFNGETWYGRCIFISWYCSLGDCTFCYRSTQHHKKVHPEKAKRSLGSILVEALLCRIFHWRIEFLTGGYGIMPFSDLLEIIKNVSLVYGDKIWLNLGVLPQTQLEQCRPYVEGVCASMETLHPELHKQVCPRKPIEPYDIMFSKFSNMHSFKKSIAVIVGLGDQIQDLHYLFDFIEKHNLDRITLYALKPVKGTPFTQGPSTEEYVTRIALLRLRFPKLEIIAGTNLRRSEEVGYIMQAGANAITKFPATKQFATKKAKLITHFIEKEKRIFVSNLAKYQDIGWIKEINALSIDEKYKDQMKKVLPSYLKALQNPVDKDTSLFDE